MGDDANAPAVLLVDDVGANLVALEAQLQSLGCRLVFATNGNEALRQLLKQEFAVVLLDVQMPGMDGFEVAELARGNPATCDVPIIFVTARHETPETVFDTYSTGAVDLLFKPVNPFVLRSKVRVFLDLYRKRRELADEIAAHRQTVAELDAFSYSVAHDLRAPLRALRGFAGILLDEHGASIDPAGGELLREILASSEHMGALIDALLSLARVSRGALVPEEVELSALVREEGGRLAASEPGRSVELIVAPDVRAQVDPALARTLLQNLVGNAWKFTSRVTPGKIEFGTSRQQGETVLFVRDNGAGFDPAYARKLFAPFQRLHTTAEFPGTGIGLATTQRIIRRHGGRIWAEGAVGEGATFYFTLPPTEREP
jgi:signal transduction histidine kinase